MSDQHSPSRQKLSVDFEGSLTGFRSRQPQVLAFGNQRGCLVLAQMRNADRVGKCLLFGVDRTYRGHRETDASDPKRTPPRLDLLIDVVLAQNG
jgi:hypothetical protein